VCIAYNCQITLVGVLQLYVSADTGAHPHSHRRCAYTQSQRVCIHKVTEVVHTQSQKVCIHTVTEGVHTHSHRK